MADIVFRVARAINDAAPAAMGPVSVTKLKDLARAAIKEIRNPTPEMLHAMTMVVPTWDDDVSRKKWQEGIDAALSPNREDPK